MVNSSSPSKWCYSEPPKMWSLQCMQVCQLYSHCQYCLVKKFAGHNWLNSAASTYEDFLVDILCHSGRHFIYIHSMQLPNRLVMLHQPSHILVVREVATRYIMCICFKVWERLNCWTVKTESMHINFKSVYLPCYAFHLSNLCLSLSNFRLSNVTFPLKITNLCPSRRILWRFIPSLLFARKLPATNLEVRMRS